VNNQAENYNQPSEQADAGEQKGCITGDEHTELNLDGHTPNGATMNNVNESGQTQAANVSEGDAAGCFFGHGCILAMSRWLHGQCKVVLGYWLVN